MDEPGWNEIDWKALGHLRQAFLNGSAGSREYWDNGTTLASYDLTFAQRIGWKWDYVLNELSSQTWSPPEGPLLDWGCGSGVASRAFLDHFGLHAVSELALWDRSPSAIEFARNKAKTRFPALQVRETDPLAEPIGTLLISHVLTELNEKQLDDLVRLAKGATAVLWIEPGTHAASRRLIAARDKLRRSFGIVAPCPHQASCPLSEGGNERHWCHHFAAPPVEPFTDGHWARFASLTGVDLRSLPLSFVVFDKRPGPVLDQGAIRIVGRPRLEKARALLFGCAASGFAEYEVIRRRDPEGFRRLKKGKWEPFWWNLELKRTGASAPETSRA